MARRYTAEEVAAIIQNADSDNELVNSDSEPDEAIPIEPTDSDNESDNSESEAGPTDSSNELVYSDSSDSNSNNDESDDNVKIKANNGMEWTTKPPKSSSFRGKNIFREIKGPVTKRTSSKETFKHLFDEAAVRKIAEYTNKRLDKDMDDELREHENTLTDVTIDEIYGYIGIIIMLGVTKKKDIEIDQIWSEKDDAVHYLPWVVCCMSRQRFKMLSRYLTFDDIETRETRAADDPKFFKCRELTNSVKGKFLSSYIPGVHLSVDENLYPFRGRCAFRQYLPSKPAKYGLKVWQLVDSDSRYLIDFDFYLGKQGNVVTKELGKAVTLKLVQPFHKSHRNITTDNYFTSTKLAEELWNKGLTLVGTVKVNRKEVFQQLRPSRQREVFSTRFFFSGYNTFISYVPKVNKAVNLLTTQHHDRSVSDTEQKKPEAIIYYNKTMGGSDTFDQTIMYTSCRRTTNRWTLRVFHYLVDATTCNGYKLMQESLSEDELNTNFGKRRSRHRVFLEKLAIDLMMTQISHRFENYRNARGVSRKLRDSFSILGFVFRQEQAEQAEPQKTTGRCHLCINKDRKSRNRCHQCNKFVCNQHATINHICDPVCDV